MTSKQFRVLAVLTVAAGFLGGAVSNVLLRGTPAQAAGAVQGMVRAKQLEVADNSGRTRMRLAVTPDGIPALSLLSATGKPQTRLDDRSLCLFDPAGNLRAYLDGDPDSASLALFDGSGRASVGLMALLGGASLSLRDPATKAEARLTLLDGSTSLHMEDAAGKDRITLLSDGDVGSDLSVFDSDGKLRARVGASQTVNKDTGATTKHPESTLTLFKANGDVSWQVP